MVVTHGVVGRSVVDAIAGHADDMARARQAFDVIRLRGPWRGIDSVEYATLVWVDWFNNRRLLEPIGYMPPAEFEAAYYQQQSQAMAA